MADDKANIHAGHRDRLREKLMADGITDATPDHEILEFLLFYCIPRKDTNEIAHRLISVFGSLCGVMDADIDDIVKLGNISRNSAILIKSILPVSRAYNSRLCRSKMRFPSLSDVGPYIRDLYTGISTEVFSALFITESGSVAKHEFLGKGDINSVGISIKDLVNKVLSAGAVSVVIAHNHPGGFALPSMEDIDITKKIRIALSHIGIALIDHVIISDGEYISLATSDKFKSIF